MTAVDVGLRAMLKTAERAVSEAEKRIHKIRENPAQGELIGFSEPDKLHEVHETSEELVLYQHSDAGSLDPVEVVPIYRGKSKFAVEYLVGDEHDHAPEVRLFDNIEDAQKFADSFKVQD